MKTVYDEILPLVDKPGRYLGTERGSYHKVPGPATLRVALAFPDVYEIGQSHLGLQILYDILNQHHDTAAERVYAPWIDMEAQLRSRKIPLVSLESFTPLDEFHIVGFSLQHELTYTNILNMLELGRIPLSAGERTPSHPLVIAGGPGAFNPEPIAEFIDAFVLGEAEEAILDVCAAYRAWDRGNRMALLDRLSRVPGVYVPSFFEPRYQADATVAEIAPLRPDYVAVHKRVLGDLNDSPVPVQPLVPHTRAVHERASVELMRGCLKGCRFCQAGYVYRPRRERDPRIVLEEAMRLVEVTGYEELSLLSLSTGDYSCVNPLLRTLMDRLAPQRVAISLPSMRVDAVSSQVLKELRRSRKTGFTLAPEAGSQRMRNVIQKQYKKQDLIEAARTIFGLGWRGLKLYFMLGLPGETQSDLLGIVDLCREVAAVCPGRAEVTASVSTFVPKPHTPFQWTEQIDLEETRARQSLLRRELTRHRIRFKWNDARLSTLEGIFSRGDRRLAPLIRKAHHLGCRFDGWTEQCQWKLWEQAMAECGVSHASYLRRRSLGEVLPWDHLRSGVSKEYLRQELARALEGASTPDCTIDHCTNCGVCDFEELQNVSYHLFDEWAQGREPAEERSVKPHARVWLCYTKMGPARFIGSRELAELFYRATRRARIPAAFSQGHHPLPRLSFSPALPVGVASKGEFLDIELSEPLETEVARRRLDAQLPEGLRVIDGWAVALDAPRIETAIRGFRYAVEIPGTVPQGALIADRIAAFNRSRSYPVQKKGKHGTRKTMDARKTTTIRISNPGCVEIEVHCTAHGTIQPATLMRALLDLDDESRGLLRITKLATLFHDESALVPQNGTTAGAGSPCYDTLARTMSG